MTGAGCYGGRGGGGGITIDITRMYIYTAEYIVADLESN